MARGFKTGGRQKGSRNRATEEARAAAKAIGILPLDYMLTVMRDPNADRKRRDAMATAAAPYLHPKLSSVEPKPITDPEKSEGVSRIEVSFVHPLRRCANEDEKGRP
jgi:hypothetical protein